MNPKHLPIDGNKGDDPAVATESLPQTAAKLLTPKEVAAWLDVSVDWVQDHATGKEPRLPPIRIGKLLRFRREDVETFISAQLEKRKPAFTKGLSAARWGKRATQCA